MGDSAVTTNSEALPKIPDAPFYALDDCRVESDTLLRFPDARWDAAVGRFVRNSVRNPLPEPDEHQTAMNGQMAFLRQRHPNVTNHFSLFEQPEADVPIEFVEKSLPLWGKSPKRVQHYDQIAGAQDPGCKAWTTRKVVSSEWKAAIEQLEPNVHDFYPVTIDFYYSNNYFKRSDMFIFRCRSSIKDHRPSDFILVSPIASGSSSRIAQIVTVVDSPGTATGRDYAPVILTLSERETRNKHCFVTPEGVGFSRYGGRFVSATLLHLLLPLLPPERFCIAPVYTH